MKFSKFKEISGMSKKVGFAFVFVVAMMGLSMQSANAALAGKGLIHPVNHFPSWFSDTKGIALQLCLDGDGATGNCSFDPVIPGNATSEEAGFGAEAFWWSAEAALNLAGGGQANLVLALEAAYGADDPAPNDQFAFGRVRIRVDVPVDGEYKIWHPFLNEADGCQPEIYTATAGIRSINVTRDTGGAAPFETILSGEVGPFLIWDPAISAAPAGFVGDPNIPHAVVGGHCGINYFRIEGPVGVNLDGSGQNFVETNLFSVMGKIFDEATVQPGIESVRTTYFRSTNNTTGTTTARINTWVKAPIHATVALSEVPQANQNGGMTFDGESTFFRRATLNATFSIVIPPQLMVTATNADGLSTTQPVNVVDHVTIKSAVWNKSAQTLKVVALSSDRIAQSSGDIPDLTLRIGANTHPMLQTGAAGRYELTLFGIAVPPARVTVTSSKGGADTEEITD